MKGGGEERRGPLIRVRAGRGRGRGGSNVALGQEHRAGCKIPAPRDGGIKQGRWREGGATQPNELGVGSGRAGHGNCRGNPGKATTQVGMRQAGPERDLPPFPPSARRNDEGRTDTPRRMIGCLLCASMKRMGLYTSSGRPSRPAAA